jgi:hypothetical protein
MKYNSQKYIISALAIICIAILIAVFIMGQQNIQTISEATPSDNPSPTPWPSQPAPGQDEWTKTETYHNEKYGYSITYPALYTSLIRASYKDVLLVYRANNNGRIYIGISPTTYSFPDQWLKATNKRESAQFGDQFIIEKRVKISGYDAIIIHSSPNYETNPYGKSIVFIKDHNLFKIDLHPDDFDWFLKNFKFD